MSEQEKEKPIENPAIVNLEAEIQKLKQEALTQRDHYVKSEMEYLSYKQLPTLLDIKVATELAKLAISAGYADRDLASGMLKQKCIDRAVLSILKGAEMGLKPHASLDTIPIINGKASIQYQAAMGLAQTKLPKSRFIIKEQTSERCEMWFKRNIEDESEEWFKKAYTIQEAKDQIVNYATSIKNNGSWKQTPDIMLAAKVVKRLSLRFQDVLMGIQIAEDQEDFPEVPISPDSHIWETAMPTFETQNAPPPVPFEAIDLDKIDVNLPPSVPSSDPPKKDPPKAEPKPKVEIPSELDDAFYENIAIPPPKPKTTDIGSVIMAKAKTESEAKKVVEAKTKVDSFQFADELLNDVVVEVSKTTLPANTKLDIFDDKTLPAEIQQLKGKNWFGSSMDPLMAENEKAYLAWRTAFCKAYPKDWKLFAKEFRKAEKKADMTNMQHLVEHSLTFLENKLINPNDLYVTFFHEILNGETK